MQSEKRKHAREAAGTDTSPALKWQTDGLVLTHLELQAGILLWNCALSCGQEQMHSVH